jgi:putative Ca2+/H+ antiporter (TMEM165/GDT1 family)
VGDKTQFTTAALAMKFSTVAVVAGSIVGMTLAILPRLSAANRFASSFR